jgi:adenine/guanine/hypoxanthine permease
MMTIVTEIPWDDYEEAIPAFVTMLGRPFTWSITNGIGAGFVTYSAIKLLNGRGRELHWITPTVPLAFLVYFALPLIQSALG